MRRSLFETFVESSNLSISAKQKAFESSSFKGFLLYYTKNCAEMLLSLGAGFAFPAYFPAYRIKERDFSRSLSMRILSYQEVVNKFQHLQRSLRQLLHNCFDQLFFLSHTLPSPVCSISNKNSYSCFFSSSLSADISARACSSFIPSPPCTILFYASFILSFWRSFSIFQRNDWNYGFDRV